MKAIGKFFLIVLVLALCCSVFFGFSEAEDVEDDKSFIDNIKDGWGNIIDTIFPGDKDEVKDPDDSGDPNGDAAQTHNSLHFSQGSAGSIRYLTPKCNGQWQSINVLSGEHFLCYMSPDTYITFKNTGTQSIYIGSSWKGDVFLEIPAGSETSNLDFSFHKDWWFWTATEHKPSDEELKANKTVISFTAEAGNELTIYDDFDNIYSGKGKTSIELEIGKEYTFTTTSKTLLLGSDFNSIVIAEIDNDDLFKFTPSTDRYAIWIKPEPEKEDPALIYIDSGSSFDIYDSEGNSLGNGDTTYSNILTIENNDNGHVYYSPNGFGELGYTHVMSGSGRVSIDVSPGGVYYFWEEYDEEPELPCVNLNFSSSVRMNPGYSITIDGQDVKSELSVQASRMYVIVGEGLNLMYMSYDCYGGSSQEIFTSGSDTYIDLVDGYSYYFWVEGETNFDGDPGNENTGYAKVYVTEPSISEGLIIANDDFSFSGETYFEIPADIGFYLYGNVESLFINGESFSNYSGHVYYFSAGESYYITSCFDDVDPYSLNGGIDQ